MIPPMLDTTFSQEQFDLMIGRLDRVLSVLVNHAKQNDLDTANRQTLKHHAEDMVAAAECILKKLETNKLCDDAKLFLKDRHNTVVGDVSINFPAAASAEERVNIIQEIRKQLYKRPQSEPAIASDYKIHEGHPWDADVNYEHIECKSPDLGTMEGDIGYLEAHGWEMYMCDRSKPGFIMVRDRILPFPQIREAVELSEALIGPADDDIPF